MGGTPPKLAVGSLPPFLCSSAVEPSTVNRLVAGSNPAGGVGITSHNFNGVYGSIYSRRVLRTF